MPKTESSGKSKASMSLKIKIKYQMVEMGEEEPAIFNIFYIYTD